MTILHDADVMRASETKDGAAASLAMAVAYLVTSAADLDNLEVVTDHDAHIIRDLKDSVGEVFEKVDVLYRELRSLQSEEMVAAVQFNSSLEQKNALWDRLAGLFLNKAA